MIRRLVLLSICFLSFVFAKAQLSFEPMQFSTDLENYINKSGNKSAMDAVAEFTGLYTANRLTNNQKTQVIRLSNELVNKNIATSAFDNYLRAMTGLIETNQTPKFDKWHKAAQLSLKKSKDAFAAFTLISKNVFQDQVVASYGAMVWKTDNAEVEMDLKSENPAFVFKNMNLTCYTPGDTVIVLNTSGKYFAATDSWVGTSGTYHWSRVGIDSATTGVYAELKHYKIDFKSGQIKADTALLYYPALFTKPIAGTLVDKAMTQSMGERSVYPQFDSHQKDFTHLSFGQGKLTGGFGLKGKILTAKGGDTSRAELLFYYKGKPTLKILAHEFMVREDKVGTKKAAIVIYLDKDSITHPQLEFTYRLNTDVINLFRNNLGVSQAPFYDSYHNMEFYADELKWDLANPKIDVDMINDNEPAKFESINYFRDYKYERLQGILDYNPLQRILLYAGKYKVKKFTVKDFADNFKSEVSMIRIQMMELHDLGFITFDPEKDQVTIKRKLYDYVNSHYGKTDYDAIAFYSVIKRYPNATINLINNDLQVQGVPKFYFSDSQNVFVIPQEQVVTFKKNRGIDFAGRIRAGKVDFYGSGFAFDYTQFQVRLNNVDSMKFFIKDETTGADLPIRSALQNVFGTLAIDHPSNKSGRKKIPGYPIFKSDVGSKIYYDKPTTQLGVYDRARFYFEVDPFTMDSLTELSFQTLTLAGTMVSGNILPDIRSEVSIQPDRSLGFVIGKSLSGYPMYGGKGRGFLGLSLSDEGFFGAGEVRYIASTSSSQQFVLLLDSMNAHCNTFTNDRTDKFPTVLAADVYEHWMPYQDSMYIVRQKELIRFSDERAKLDGTIFLTPEKMGAKGLTYIREAELTSGNFWLQPDHVLADSSHFRLRNYTDSSKFAFYSGSVKSTVDLTAGVGLFGYNSLGVNSDFTYNSYVGSFKQFSWLMDDRRLDFTPYQANGQDESYLLSARKSQDSLSFRTSLTTLDLKDFTLYAKQIPYISVGDARVFADSQQVTIKANAEMQELRRARIIADTTLKYHTIEKATVTILGRFAIRGSGNYQYTDKNKNVQQFYLDEIRIDSAHRLLGKTNITDSSNFFVGNHIRFQGNALLKSIQKNLEYDGFFQAQHELPYPQTDWFRQSAVINPDSVFLKLNPQLTNLNRQALMTGLSVSDSLHRFPLFFSRKKNGSDQELMRVEGTLVYDEKLRLFKMGPHEKLFGSEVKGNYLELSDGKQNIFYEGKFRFGFEGGKFEMNAAGNAVYNYSDTSFSMNLMMLLNFPLPPVAIRVMFDTLNYQSSAAGEAKFDEQMLGHALPEVIGDEKNLKRVMADFGDKEIRMVNDLEKTIFISQMNLRWNQNTRSFTTDGDISINSFDKYKLERKVGGRLEITKRRSGDDITLYILSKGGSWYYFKYQRGIMYVVGSDPLFNQYIKDNFEKLSKDDTYKLRQANIGDRNKFVKNMKAQQK